MNFLIQAYACSAHQGGEYAVSWGWITHLDQVVNDSDTIYVVSLTLTDQEIQAAGLKHVKIITINGMDRYRFLNFNAIYYYIWLNKAYKAVKKTNKKIDVVHIYSLSDFRQPGKWYKLKDAYTIWGPVGGGQICPADLHCYDDKRGTIRNIVNKIYGYNLIYKQRIRKYSRIYACNQETSCFMEGSKILIDVPLNDQFKELEIEKRKSEIPTILFVGRLINKKGVLFLLDILKYIDANIQYQVLIFGDGEQREMISDRIMDLGLQSKVFLKGKILYRQISDVYKKADIFVLPSLRESGGSVLIEAMAHKLPIVALNMSLSKLLNEKQCGLFVSINQSEKEILKQFADNLTKLIRQPELRDFYGNNGYQFVNKELTWSSMIKEVYGSFLNTTDGA